MQYILLKISYFERGLSKSLKKVNFIFSFELSYFYWAKLSEIKIPLFVILGGSVIFGLVRGPLKSCG